MPNCAVGPVDIRTVSVLWDGSTDFTTNLTPSVDVQQGDLIKVTLTMACAGLFQCTLTVYDDRLWTSVLRSDDTQTLTIGIDHAGVPYTMSQYPLPPRTVTSQYRIAHATLSMCLIGKNY